MELDIMDMDGCGQAASNEFHRFCDLPTELRFRIWSYNLPGPRVVKVWYQKSCPEQSGPPGLRSSTPVPVNLHVNRESRDETLRSHPLHFGFHDRPGVIPLDPKQDVLFFVPSPPQPGCYAADLFADIKASLMLARGQELARLRRLAIDAAPTLLPSGRPPPAVQMAQDPYQLCQTRRTLEVLEDIRRYLPGLREFHLVTPPENAYPDEAKPDGPYHAHHAHHHHHAAAAATTGLKVSIEEWAKRAMAILAEETEGWDTPVCSVGSADRLLLGPAAAPVPCLRSFHMALPRTCPAFDLVRNSLRDLLRQIRPPRLRCSSSGAAG